MIVDTILAKVIGTQNERDLKKLRPIVAEINSREADVQRLSDDQLRDKTAEFRTRLANGETLDDLLPDAFAVVREAGLRTLNMRHFDVQLIGGIVLHRGKIAEMKTGEGKTLVATLPVYLNALEGKGVHVVTVNDYLARRDSEWMGRIYRFLGMSVGVIQHDLNDQERQVAYGADITYGTNNEFGFDYLRDNMKFDLAHYVQRGHNFAMVDEVDSILIDEARTPLIISGPAEESTELYYEVDRIIPRLTPGAVTRGDVKAEEREELEKTGDYIVDEKHKTVTLTESGMAKAEQMLAHRLQPGGLYDPVNMPLLHHINQALRAHTLFQLDVDYMIKDGGVVIVDEFTGRLMPGRRWSDGLHQAVEAKERVKIERENQTLATVTFQNYFRKYKKLSGMTGTADTEAEEFGKIYNLDVMVIPTNRVLRRVEEPDTVYRTEREKFEAIVGDIIEQQRHGPPGPRRHGLDREVGAALEAAQAARHQARGPQREVPRAGSRDRRAGGSQGDGHDRHQHGRPRHRHPPRRQPRVHGAPADPRRRDRGETAESRSEVRRRRRVRLLLPPRQLLSRAAPGVRAHLQRAQERRPTPSTTTSWTSAGLHIIATERHEARRIDNQLRGRAGRQGDPGSSRFYLSLEDDLMRIFGSDRIAGLMQRLGMEEGVPIEHKMVTKAIERAQKQVEAQNFSVRKHLLEYDDVMNKQRESVYALRREVLEGKIHITEEEEVDSREYLITLAEELLDSTVDIYAGPDIDVEERDYGALKTAVAEIYGLDVAELDSTRARRSQGRRDRRRAVGADHPQVRGEGTAHRHRDPAPGRARHHAPDRRRAVEGPPLQPRPPEGRHRPARLRAARPARRVQEGELRAVLRDEGPDRRGDRPVPVAADAGGDRGRPGAGPGPAGGAATPCAGHAQRPVVGPAALAVRRHARRRCAGHGEAPRPARSGGDDVVRQVKRDEPKVGRNDPCPCGSGKKYKKCHGA